MCDFAVHRNPQDEGDVWDQHRQSGCRGPKKAKAAHKGNFNFHPQNLP